MTAVGLRARKKERTREELVAAALELFVVQGFDNTTVDQIASAVDVSPRTFFRYFPTKEDVLFGDELGEEDQRSALVMERLRNHPDGATPGPLLRAALLELADSYEGELSKLLLRKRVIEATPALWTRAVERRHRWEVGVVDELRARFHGDADTMLSLRVTVAATTAALHAAVETWLESDGRTDLTALIRHAFDHLAAGLDLPAHPAPSSPSTARHGARS